ncbi:hypothetical protein VE02_01441 [Pseudogymnoascus sp. 03VT05]|nr:hypothetical protein VE02_01441 [Pseudogymnoascus sp. 03VT05]
MDGFGASYSAPKAVEGEQERPEHASNIGKPPSKQKGRRNIMLEKFRADVEPSRPPYTYTPMPFFFYGSLTDPLRLQEILQLPAPPYPALVHGPINNHVDGMAFVVETGEQEKMLKYYETDAYHIEGVRISVAGKLVFGRTFVWASDPAELVAGTWSLEEWKKDIDEEMASHFRPLED